MDIANWRRIQLPLLLLGAGLLVGNQMGEHSPKKVALSELTAHPERYSGMYIETEGYVVPGLMSHYGEIAERLNSSCMPSNMSLVINGKDASIWKYGGIRTEIKYRKVTISGIFYNYDNPYYVRGGAYNGSLFSNTIGPLKKTALVKVSGIYCKK